MRSNISAYSYLLPPADSNTTTHKPVRAIKKAASDSFVRIVNALSAVDGRCYWNAPRHTSINSLLGSLPRPTLERVLANLEQA